MSAWTAFKTATTTGFTMVDTAAHTANRGMNSLHFLAKAGEAHAQHYCEDTIAELAANAGMRQLLRVNSAKTQVSRELAKLKKEIESDPLLESVFYGLADELFTPKTPSKPAE